MYSINSGSQSVVIRKVGTPVLRGAATEWPQSSRKEFRPQRGRLKVCQSAALAPGSHTSACMKKEALAARYRVTEGKGFRLDDFDPSDTWKLKSRDHAQQW